MTRQRRTCLLSHLLFLSDRYLKISKSKLIDGGPLERRGFKRKFQLWGKLKQSDRKGSSLNE